ncbi:ribonuclease Y [bacterium]|nr:MAG: ribonuclease Y [bacterium]
MEPTTIALVVLAILSAALIAVILLKKGPGAQNVAADAGEMVAEARKQAEIIKKEAELKIKEELLAQRSKFEKEFDDKRQEITSQEKRLQQKEENITRKEETLDKRDERLAETEKKLSQRQSDLDKKQNKIAEMEKEINQTLEKVAGMTAEEAKEELKSNLLSEARHEAARAIREIEDEAKKSADKKAKEYICLAIQRYAGEYVAEKTVSSVHLPNEEMKGRIIGREGRNIRAIEAATGIDLIVDDTPETVLLSGYNPVRREVARMALERLIADGRIHPARIEEVVEKAEKDIEKEIQEAGEQATFDVGVHGIASELVTLLGRLKFRSSFAQNVLEHSIEVAFLCGVMAAELGLNVKMAKRAGLLHDIGKAVDHEIEGSHAVIGADLARKYREPKQVISAIHSHHDDIPASSILDVLVQAADALSAARPGARREMIETYVRRLEDLEKIANSFDVVAKSFAIQAGRELRIMVMSDKVDDDGSFLLAKDIARKVEQELNYPGQIKITVIRETRAVDFAK